MRYSAAEGRTTSLLLTAFGLLVGLSVAMAARAQLAHAARAGSRPAWRSPHLVGALLYEALAVTPLAIYLAIRYPGWSTLYLFSGWPGWLVTLGLALAPALLAAVGFQLSAACIRAGLPLVARTLLVLIGGATVALGVWAGPRLIHVSDGLAWADAGGPSGELAAILAFALPVLLAGWVFLLALSWVEGRKLSRMLAFQREARAQDGSPPPVQDAGVLT